MTELGQLGQLERAPERVRTARLELAPPAPEDAEEIFHRYASDFRVTRMLSWKRHRAVEDSRGFVKASQEAWRRWPAGPYLIRHRDGQLLGGTGLAFSSSPDRAETGFVLARDAWGLGYATEALSAVVAVAARLGLVELSAHCHPDHEASRRVLEKCAFEPSEGGPVAGMLPNLDSETPMSLMRYERCLEAACRETMASLYGAGR